MPTYRGGPAMNFEFVRMAMVAEGLHTHPFVDKTHVLGR
jgi:hypothetical protein